MATANPTPTARAAQAPQAPAAPRGGRGYWATAARRLARNRPAVVGLAGLLLILGAVTLAPWLAPYEPTKIDARAILQPPSPAHPFGTDDLGRDLLSRVLWGGRESLRVGFLGVGIAVAGGVLLGLASGYFGGWLDGLVQRASEVVMALPLILLLICIVSVLGSGLIPVMIAIGLAEIPAFARIVRGAVLSARAYDYVLAARALGVSDWGIMLRHILPNVVAPVVVIGTVTLGFAVMTGAGLSYIGLGAQPPSPEWGAMLNQGRRYLYDAWWMSIFPGLPLFFTVLFVNLLGDGLRDALDPRL